jgi:hypothetical protein
MTWALQAAAECASATEVWAPVVVVIALFCAFGAVLFWVLR